MSDVPCVICIQDVILIFFWGHLLYYHKKAPFEQTSARFEKKKCVPRLMNVINLLCSENTRNTNKNTRYRIATSFSLLKQLFGIRGYSQ